MNSAGSSRASRLERSIRRRANQAFSQAVSGPGDTKSAVLNIQSDLAVKLTVPNGQLQIGK